MKAPPVKLLGDKVMLGTAQVASLVREFPEEIQVVENGGAVIGFVHVEGDRFRSNGVAYKSLAEAVAAVLRRPGKAGASKYHNHKTEVDGVVFDSKKEAKRYRELKLREQAGEIYELMLQPEFPCFVNGKKVCTYRADFCYLLHKDCRELPEVEDVKGFKTDVYRLKKKLVEALYGIEIKEV